MKPQRVRDPVHNLIEFDMNDQLEHALWRVIETPEFQRLRRIRQLGFSELVFPGATHTRFAHSIGVFHTARNLMRVVDRHVRSGGGRPRVHQQNVALAAALVHDVGHGMFSHAFEFVGEALGLPMADHERVSGEIIRTREIAGILSPELGTGFANDVATLIARKAPGNLYDAVVSSQFDADRLDYMQRDRLMTGVQSSGIDLTWLLSNLQVEAVPTGVDGEEAGSVETLVLGPKAIQTAESYVLSLFHLYPNVYLHKTTRGAELLFGALLTRLIRLGSEGHNGKAGLPPNHPLMRFAREPDQLENALRLDDQVFWGALPMMQDAEDEGVARMAGAMRDRKLMACTDIRVAVEAGLEPRKGEERRQRRVRVERTCRQIEAGVAPLLTDAATMRPKLLLDGYGRGKNKREPYKRFQDSSTPLNRIMIQTGPGKTEDIIAFSPVIAGAETFEVCRAYTFRDDTATQNVVGNIVRTEIEEAHDADA